ncbi:MAG: exoribonuclease II [Deltaproteobacteria bacterium]|nr:MAG: exoribonuclease II [Deltaproteobacteria bacterium]
METGNIVEYIDRQKIICAVVQQVKQKRLRLLAETNREVNLAISRVSHHSNRSLDPALGRDDTIAALKKIGAERQRLTEQINIRKLWEVLNTEEEWIDLPTMTGLCFPGKPDSDREAAVVRAFFEDRLYFKFNHDRFFPHSATQVEQILNRRKEEARRQKLIETGAARIKGLLKNQETRPIPIQMDTLSDLEQTVMVILKDYYLFGKESREADIARGILKTAGLDQNDDLFNALVHLGVFSKDENIELLRENISIEFPPDVKAHADALVKEKIADPDADRRVNLTQLDVMTIDGPATLDLDDAISIEKRGPNFRIGIHITDVAHYIKKRDPTDIDAMNRASSIYLPDRKIPMLCPSLSEGLFSLTAGEVRPAITTWVLMSPWGVILESEVVPSLIRVKSQLFYRDVNRSIDSSASLRSLYDLAGKYRSLRFDANATQISLPEIHLWLDQAGTIQLNRVDRESPARLIVSEMMILANAMMARFLSDHKMPAIFRSQADPKKRLYKGMEGTLFQNWMQRRQLSRFQLGCLPEKHAGLGVDAYVTATSPIRKYTDLITQRQIRAVLGMETPYTAEEIDRIIASIRQPMTLVARTQQKRYRYWLLKHFEKQVGQKTTAYVLFKRRHNYQILLSEYMVECALPLSEGLMLSPEDMIEVTIQHANARNDKLSVSLC